MSGSLRSLGGDAAWTHVHKVPSLDHEVLYNPAGRKRNTNQAITMTHSNIGIYSWGVALIDCVVLVKYWGLLLDQHARTQYNRSYVWGDHACYSNRGDICICQIASHHPTENMSWLLTFFEQFVCNTIQHHNGPLEGAVHNVSVGTVNTSTSPNHTFLLILVVVCLLVASFFTSSCLR